MPIFYEFSEFAGAVIDGVYTWEEAIGFISPGSTLAFQLILGAALDPSTKEVNIRASILKYFVDTLEDIEGEDLIIDADIEMVRNRKKWIHLNYLNRNEGNKIIYNLFLAPATREDDEGYKLAALEDLIDKYIYDSDGGNRAISFYDISTLPNLTEIGKIHLRQGSRSPVITAADDRTKFRIIRVQAHISVKLITN